MSDKTNKDKLDKPDMQPDILVHIFYLFMYQPQWNVCFDCIDVVKYV